MCPVSLEHYPVCNALLFGWSEAFGWKGHCEFRTAMIFPCDSECSFVQMRMEELNLHIIQL